MFILVNSLTTGTVLLLMFLFALFVLFVLLCC